MKILIALICLAALVGALWFGFSSRSQVSPLPSSGSASTEKLESEPGSEKSASSAVVKPSGAKPTATPSAQTAKNLEYPSPLPPPAMAAEPKTGTPSEVEPEEMARRIAARQLQGQSDPKQASPTPTATPRKK